MKYYIAVCLPALLLLLLTGCDPKKKDTGPDLSQVRMNYYYIYDGTTDSTYVSYISYIGTEMYQLGGLYDSVSFNGKKIPPYGQAYLGFAGFVDSGTFVYTNLLGNRYQQTVSNLPVYTLPAGFTSINTHANDTVTWQGPALTGGQTMNLNLKAGQVLNESLNNLQRPYIALDTVWTKLHLPVGETIQARLGFIDGYITATGAPQGSVLDVRIQAADRDVMVY